MLLAAARMTPGFMPDDEGVALHLAARRAAGSGLGPLVEVGAYRGRSTLYLAAGIMAAALAGRGVPGAVPPRPGARGPSKEVPRPGSRPEPAGGAPAAKAAHQARSPLLYSVDHHRGSEEMQAGWVHHDASLVDTATGRMDSLPSWRAAVERGDAEDLVVAIVGDSPSVAADWSAPLSLLLLDGGHGEEIAWADYAGWSRQVAPGGLLVIHDVFADPADGGRPPYEIYLDALAGGRFIEEPAAGRGSLRVLRRRA